MMCVQSMHANALMTKVMPMLSTRVKPLNAFQRYNLISENSDSILFCTVQVEFCLAVGRYTRTGHLIENLLTYKVVQQSHINCVSSHHLSYN